MSKKFYEEIIRNMENGQSIDNILGKRIEQYANCIARTVMPISYEELPVLYAALKMITNSIVRIEPEVKEAGEDAYRITKNRLNSIVVKVPEKED